MHLNECLPFEDETVSSITTSNNIRKIPGNCHRQTKHLKSYECSECDQIFDHSFALENHLVMVHEKEKPYECILCKARFVFKWRYMKHKNSHEETNQRTCHYYNNGKECPYVNIGYKFLHEDASLCKFATKCQRLLCQFKH